MSSLMQPQQVPRRVSQDINTLTCFDACLPGLSRQWRSIPRGVGLALDVCCDDGHQMTFDKPKFTCRSSTFTLSSGRELGFALGLTKESYVPLQPKDYYGRVNPRFGSRFNQMHGLELFERADTWWVKRPLILIPGLPGGRLCVKQTEIARICLETGLFDCLVGVDRPGYGLSQPFPEGTIASFGRDIEELVNELFPSSSVKVGILGWSGGGPYVAGVATNESFHPRLRGAIVLGGLGLMKEKGVRNRNYDLITRGTYDAKDNGTRSYSLGPTMKFASNSVLTMLNNWFYKTYVAPGPALVGQPELIDQIVAANKGKSQREIDALIAQVIIKALPQDSTKEPTAPQNGSEGPEKNRRAKRCWERELANVEEAVCSCKYYGTAGMNKDCQILINEWDVDWETVRKVKWGIAQGSEDNNVPIGHWQWWDEKLPKAETLLLDGQESMSLMTTREMYELMRRVYGDGGAGCSIM